MFSTSGGGCSVHWGEGVQYIGGMFSTSGGVCSVHWGGGCVLATCLAMEFDGVMLALQLGSTFCNNCRDFLRPLQVAVRHCNV